MNDKEKVFQEVFQIEELYSLEDYTKYQMVNTSIPQNTVKENVNKSEYVRVIFDFNGQEKEIILKKENAKKYFHF